MGERLPTRPAEGYHGCRRLALSGGLSAKRRRGMRRQRRSSQSPPTKAYPQRYVEETERSEERRRQAEHGKMFSRGDHSGLSVKRRRGMRRQRRSSQGPPTKAYPQRYVEESERSEGRRWQAEHGRLFCRQTTGVLTRWFAVFRNRRRPTIGTPTHSQHPRTDRPRRPKGIDVSHPRCIMVSSRKHHRSVLRYRPDRGRDHVVGADPSQGMAGRVREPRRWRLGAGPSEGSGRAFFAFSVPPGPARRDCRQVPGIYDESRNQDTRSTRRPSPAGSGPRHLRAPVRRWRRR